MTFQKRLRAVMQAGNLTVADLARWFDRPDPTVRGWVANGGQPAGGPLDILETYNLLETLEHLIKRKRDFPLPRLSPSQRIDRLRKIQQQALGR